MEEEGLIGVAGGDRVGARVRGKALREMGREAGRNGKGAFYEALGFDVGCAKGVTVLVDFSAGVGYTRRPGQLTLPSAI